MVYSGQRRWQASSKIKQIVFDFNKITMERLIQEIPYKIK